MTRQRDGKTRPILMTSMPDIRTLTSRGRMVFIFGEGFWIQVVFHCPGAMENHRSTVVWRTSVQFETPYYLCHFKTESCNSNHLSKNMTCAIGLLKKHELWKLKAGRVVSHSFRHAEFNGV